MSTTNTPTWLNLDALDIPQESLDYVQKVIAKLRELVPVIEHVAMQASLVEEAITIDDELPEGVYEAIREATGQAEVHDLLMLIGWHACGPSDSLLTEQGRKEILDKRGL